MAEVDDMRLKENKAKKMKIEVDIQKMTCKIGLLTSFPFFPSCYKCSSKIWKQNKVQHPHPQSSQRTVK